MLRSLAIAGLAALSLTASADATTFVTAPDAGRTATPCTTEQPCEVHYALGQMTTGDVTLMTAGTYMPKYPGLKVAAGTLRGDAGARPEITGSGIAVAAGAAAEHLKIDATGNAAVTVAGQASDIQAGPIYSGEPTAVVAPGGLLRDSTAYALGTNSIAVAAASAETANPATARLLNVTAVASGASAIGVRAAALTYTLPGKCVTAFVHLAVRNVIARSDHGPDLLVKTSEPDPPCAGHSVATMDVSSSNYRTAVSSGGGALTLGAGNQTSAALTDGVLADDGLHEAPGAPTIDAGATDPLLGPIDTDGTPVPSGKAPDIGGDEWPAPFLGEPPASPTPEPTPAPSPAPAATQTPPDNVKPAPPVASVANLLALSAPTRIARSVLRRRGLPVTATLRGPGTIGAKLVVVRHGREITLATGHATSLGGVTTLRLRGARKVLRRLGRRRVRAAVSLIADGSGYLPATRNAQLTIGRAH